MAAKIYRNRTSKMIRGHLRILVLKGLEEGEKSGYGLMKYIEEKIGSKPSSGSIYPVMDALKEKGLVKVKEEGRRKIYCLTTQGKKVVKKAEEQKEDLMKRFSEGFKMMTTLTGEKTGPFDEMMKAMHKGEIPFKQMGLELAKLRQEIVRLNSKKLPQQDKEKAKKILKEATQKLKRIR